MHQLNARVGGFQFVLVGDQHEMPMVHIMSDEFNLRVSDWTGDVRAKCLMADY
jgi:vacuolar protein sorting-associated protein 13A/C